MKVVSSTIISAMPSRPSVKRTPHVGIHGTSNRCCQPVTAGSNAHQSPIESTNSMAKTIVASERGHVPAPDVHFVLALGRASAAEPIGERADERNEEQRRKDPAVVADRKQKLAHLVTGR